MAKNGALAVRQLPVPEPAGRLSSGPRHRRRRNGENWGDSRRAATRLACPDVRSIDDVNGPRVSTWAAR